MNKLTISWILNRDGERKGGLQKEPTWALVDHFLHQAKEKGGTISLSIIDGEDEGPDHIQLTAENGHYLLGLNEVDGDDYEVRTFYDPNAKGQVEMEGNVWDARKICTDFAIVQRAFKEFFEDGDVSRELLD